MCPSIAHSNLYRIVAVAREYAGLPKFRCVCGIQTQAPIDSIQPKTVWYKTRSARFNVASVSKH